MEFRLSFARCARKHSTSCVGRWSTVFLIFSAFAFSMLGGCKSSGVGPGVSASTQNPALQVQLDAPSDYQLDVLQNGTAAYIDTDHTLTDIPSHYSNLCLLRTANGDKFYEDPGFLTFEVNRTVTVYVAYALKQNGVIPDWLASWHDTGDTIYLASAGKGGAKPLQLFSKQFSPGTVSIDGNGKGKFMYVVFLEDPLRSSLSACSTLSDAVLSFSWQPPEDFSGGYRVYQGGSAEEVNKKVAEIHPGEDLIDATQPMIEYDADLELGLYDGETTCFSVSAFSNQGESEKSPPICVTL